MPVEGKTHSEVVAAIKVGGSVTRLLVVDPETEAFFKRCGVSPTSDHLTGESSVVGELSEIRDAACLFCLLSPPRSSDGCRATSCPPPHVPSSRRKLIHTQIHRIRQITV